LHFDDDLLKCGWVKSRRELNEGEDRVGITQSLDLLNESSWLDSVSVRVVLLDLLEITDDHSYS
jgi:hypothetical protein